MTTCQQSLIGRPVHRPRKTFYPLPWSHVAHIHRSMSVPNEEITVWELRRSSEVIAKLEVTDQDFPWNFGHITTSDSFETIRHYFQVQRDPETAKSIREQLRRQQVTLSPQQGLPVREFTLIVDGERARFQFV